MHRRDFLSRSAVALAGSASLPVLAQQGTSLPGTESQSGSKAAAAIPRVTQAGTLRGEMLYRPLGSTGVEVSVIGLGGSHLGQPNVQEEDAIKLVHEALDRGINFLDNSWDYNEGRSEMRVGKALAQGGYRQKAFVMTKIDGRTKEAAASQIDESLQAAEGGPRRPAAAP